MQRNFELKPQLPNRRLRPTDLLQGEKIDRLAAEFERKTEAKGAVLREQEELMTRDQPLEYPRPQREDYEQTQGQRTVRANIIDITTRLPDMRNISKARSSNGYATLSNPHKRRDGEEIVGSKVYLPIDLHRKLAIYCIEHNVSKSDLMTALVRSCVAG